MTGQIGHGGTEGGDLRQREIDEDDASFHHMQPQIGVNPRQDQSCDKRDDEDRENVHLFQRFHQPRNVVIEKFEIVSEFRSTSDRRIHHQDLCASSLCH